MNIIDKMSSDIVLRIIQLDVDPSITSEKNITFNSILEQCKLILGNINDIKNVILVVKLNIKKIKLTKYNTEKQYQSALDKFVSLQKKLLLSLQKKLILINNILVDVLLVLIKLSKPEVQLELTTL